ncbi:MAG: hypothetical protein J6U22_09630 [Bacteroidaceae bacterium]|nr:hypothetical protein [Bacteroidaceae bacterium]MBO7539206.1 hypothetical protein [Prevotella sp.]
MKNYSNNAPVKQVTLDGMMTICQYENGMHSADFECCEDVNMEPFCTRCKVQCMRDGNVYITELPKRGRNKALYREENCSLTLGHNQRYYFVFSLPEQQINELPSQLVRQANAVAHKVMMDLLLDY